MTATIVAQGVKKTFTGGKRSKKRSVDVLKGINLSIYPGEMVSIVGPSGSGKSTLLYCLSGLEAATEGSIQIMSNQVVKASRNTVAKIRREHVGFIFQSYNLIPSLNVRDNVALPTRLAGHPVSAAHVKAVLKSVGLYERLKNKPADLSGGEQQRVAIARVLVGNADIVFADEPTGALDTKNGREVLTMLRSIGTDPHRSVVVVTHDLEAASRADRVLVLRDGQIIKEMGRSSASEIFDVIGE